MGPGIIRLPTSAKVDFCNTSFAKRLFFQSQTSRFRPKNHQKNKTGDKHEQTPFVDPRYLKNSQNGIPVEGESGYLMEIPKVQNHDFP